MKNEKIVYIATNPWNDIWRRRHQIISRIAKNNIVLWVEPPLNLFSSSAVSRIKLKRLVEFLWNPREEKKNVFIFPLINMFPFNRFYVIKKLNRAIYLFFFKKAIWSLELTNPILWVTFNRSFEHFIGELGEKLVCYDAFDKITRFADEHNLLMIKKIESWEEEVCKRAVIIFSMSDILKKYLERYNKNVFTVLNGVDFKLYSKSLSHDIETPSDIKGIKKPIVGSISSIGKPTDMDLINFIAYNHPDLSIVMIGPILPPVDCQSIKELKKFKNVHFIGMKNVQFLPNYLKSIDVALIPLKPREEGNMYISHPNRLFMYMAAGKPIVTTRLSEIDKYKDVLKIADNKEDFIPLIEQSLKENSNELVNKRIEIAKENTWDRRVETIENLIEKHILKKSEEFFE